MRTVSDDATHNTQPVYQLQRITLFCAHYFTSMFNCVAHITILRHFNAYKSSAVAEMGDRLITIDAGLKLGGGAAVPLSVGNWFPV